MSIVKTLSSPIGTYHPIIRKWPGRTFNITRWLLIVEFAGLIPILVIFGLAQPDLYRSAMWQIGYDHRLNSDPNMVLYALANHQPVPKIPLIWSSKLTNFNVAISVVSLFFLLCKLMGIIMMLWVPTLALFVNIAMVALYTVSVYGQIGPDHADPRYPSPAAWYWRYGCDMAKPSGMYTSCQIAQASLFITLYMLVVYLVSLGLALKAMWPNKENDIVEEEEKELETKYYDTKDVELQGMPSPLVGTVPFTPRTQAFHTLNRDLPLRQPEPAGFS